ncbi:MAG: DUF6069 family protein [Anaerolinea sp.]|nr:DUF6069 family protein [Anaerolinea sp.]
MSTAPVSQEQLAPAGRVWRVGAIAAAIAAVVNVIIWLIASVLGVPFNISPPQLPPIPFAIPVVLATVVGVLAGTLVLTLMPRFSQRPITTFRTVAIIALVLSFAQPLLLLTGAMPTSGPVGIETIIVLEIMHVAAGAVAIYFLTTRTRA